ncbi:MAG: DNA-directed RNA polymerase subunit beta, partial [Firmicutes bacterium]|nr:DNA-directed RNA polymerase subunit beta [Bacillota bacterium]
LSAKGENVPEPGVPESFKVLIKELQSLGLDVKVLNELDEEIEIRELDDEPLREAQGLELLPEGGEEGEGQELHRLMEDTAGGARELFEPGAGMDFDQEAETAYAILRRGSQSSSESEDRAESNEDDEMHDDDEDDEY